jgi:hypothetical protein
MKITRSSFLATAATAAAALVLRPHDLAAALAARDEGQLDLRSSVGETFHARSESGALVTLRLERVDELRSDTTIEQFRLVFSGDERLPLAEGTWRLVASDGRRAGDVFLVPGGVSASGSPLFRADFCLLAGPVPANPPR